MTRNDLLNRNQDLIQHAASILREMPRYELAMEERSRSEGRASLAVRTRNFGRLDLLVEDRPQGSCDVTDGETTLEVTLRPGVATRVKLRGYKVESGTAPVCVAARSITLPA